MLKKIVDYIIALGKRHPYTHLFRKPDIFTATYEAVS
jgi:hypothetical protein